jgi:AAA family ATP:ADP antiporter
MRRLQTEGRAARSFVSSSYFWLLLSVAMSASLVGVLVELQFYAAAAQSERTPQESAALFANLYLGLNTIALVVQLYMTPIIHRLAGLAGTLLVLPTTLIGLMPTVLLGPALPAGSILRFVEGGLKSSIHRSSWEQVYLPIEPHHRVAAKLLVDGVGARMAEGLGAVLLLVWLLVVVNDQGIAGLSTSWISVALLVPLCLWFRLTRRLRRRSVERPTNERAAEAGPPACVTDS